MITLPFPTKDKMCGQRQVDCLTLPVAPRANSRIRFNDDAKPGQAMEPLDAVAWAGELIKGGKIFDTIDISGPGDPLAAPGPTLETLDLLHASWPDIKTTITTLGLDAPEIAPALAERGVDRVNIQVDAHDPEIVQKIYAWIRPGKKTIPLARVAALLIERQREAVTTLHKAGLKINIQTTVYPGINDQHVEAIASQMADLGADSMTVLPFSPEVADREMMPTDDALVMTAARKAAAKHLPVIEAAPKGRVPPPSGDIQAPGVLLPKPSKERPNVAVVSSNGMDIDLHLGQADRILVYGPRADGLACLLEARLAPEAGTGTNRWQTLAEECLFDCFALLAANAGDNPQKVLAGLGIKVLITEDNIEGTVDVLYGGGRKKKCKK